ncbi:quinone oxidoreductase family protein [Microbacterium sp. RD1]|uniref:quinone oxidoreductase family protein n=1 Tax=Microbacterium sp. RD1 TaxID=3457313 RepID=UPI003FA5DF4B
MSDSMTTVELRELGSPENLHVVRARIPAPAPGQVLVEVEAAGVIFADVLLRRGQYVHRPSLPYRPGREVVGRIVALGPDVDTYRTGDRIFGMLMGGGYAEYAIVDLVHRPGADGLGLGRVAWRVGEDVPAGQALSHGNNLRIAHLILHGRADVRGGQRILLHAASGGVGAHLTRLSRVAGLEVIALAGSEEKAQYCAANGAHHVVRYKEQDYADVVRDITGGEGVDISVNSVGADTLAKDADLLRPEAQLIISGKAAGAGSVSPSAHMKSLTYKHFASYTHFGRAEDLPATELVAAELLAPSHEDKLEEFLLADVVPAHALLEAGAHFGKVVLYPRS